MQGNIEKLSTSKLESFKADMWLLAPPCQPYTRRGLQKDAADDRASSFMKLLSKLPEMQASTTLYYMTLWSMANFHAFVYLFGNTVWLVPTFAQVSGCRMLSLKLCMLMLCQSRTQQPTANSYAFSKTVLATQPFEIHRCAPQHPFGHAGTP